MDFFKQASHLTRTYDAANSNISRGMRTQGNNLKTQCCNNESIVVSIELFKQNTEYF